MEGQQLQLVNGIVYFGVKGESMESWRKQKARIKARGNQTLTTIDKCPKRTPNMKADMLENIYEMICESTLIYGLEIWGVGGGWVGNSEHRGDTVRKCYEFLDVRSKSR
jgi:hypothetical protein